MAAADIVLSITENLSSFDAKLYLFVLDKGFQAFLNLVVMEYHPKQVAPLKIEN